MRRLWLSKCTDVVPFNAKVTHIHTTGGTNIEHKKMMLKHFLSFVLPREFISICSSGSFRV